VEQFDTQNLGRVVVVFVSKLKELVDSYMQKLPGLGEYCERCLRTERWGGSVVLMVVDAAFTSIGLNYFTAVVPRVMEFNKNFVEKGRIKSLSDLAGADINNLMVVWKNKRSWTVARDVASYLLTISEDDKLALRTWAKKSSLERWRENPIGAVKGVGLVTYQYLRMMGGVDTVMPDKIVKRVINGILTKAGLEPVDNDIEFIEKAEEIASLCGYKPIELCWMTWLIQAEKGITRMEKYSNILTKI